jgi:hypothetical protein
MVASNRYSSGLFAPVVAAMVAWVCVGCGEERTDIPAEPFVVESVRASPEEPRGHPSEILERYRVAAGDTSPSRVRTLHLTGTEEPRAGSTFSIWFAAPNLAQKETDTPTSAPYSRTYDGRQGWLAGPVKAVGRGWNGLSPQTQFALWILHIDLLGLIPAAMADGGVVGFTYKGPSAAHGRPMECLAITGVVSATKELCFDAATHLPATLMFEGAPIMPNDPPGRQLVRFREFVTVDGLKMPSIVTHEWLGEDKIIGTKRIERFVLNGEIDRSRFRQPAATP